MAVIMVLAIMALVEKNIKPIQSGVGRIKCVFALSKIWLAKSLVACKLVNVEEENNYSK